MPPLLGILEEFVATMTFSSTQDQVCFALQPTDNEAIEDPFLLAMTLTGDGAVMPVGSSVLVVNENDCKA